MKIDYNKLRAKYQKMRPGVAYSFDDVMEVGLTVLGYKLGSKNRSMLGAKDIGLLIYKLWGYLVNVVAVNGVMTEVRGYWFVGSVFGTKRNLMIKYLTLVFDGTQTEPLEVLVERVSAMCGIHAAVVAREIEFCIESGILTRNSESVSGSYFDVLPAKDTELRQILDVLNTRDSMSMTDLRHELPHINYGSMSNSKRRLVGTGRAVHDNVSKHLIAIRTDVETTLENTRRERRFLDERSQLRTEKSS